MQLTKQIIGRFTRFGARRSRAAHPTVPEPEVLHTYSAPWRASHVGGGVAGPVQRPITAHAHTPRSARRSAGNALVRDFAQGPRSA